MQWRNMKGGLPSPGRQAEEGGKRVAKWRR